MNTTSHAPCHAARIPSPFGDLFAVVDDEGALLRLDFVGGKERAGAEGELEARLRAEGFDLRWSRERLAAVAEALRAYFAGETRSFDLPVAPSGTPFQKRVWRELARIPYGETVTYGELARRVGRPGAARAVGRANATNPISLVLPCHRVVGSNGTLTGYAGGLERKRALLAHEGAAAAGARA